MSDPKEPTPPRVGSLDLIASLKVTRAQATTGVKRPVSVHRIVRCPSCFATYRAGPGCDACEGGLTTRDETLTVSVPAGIAFGVKLRLAGKGHESVKDATGDLYLTIELDAPKTIPRSESMDDAPHESPSSSHEAPVTGSLWVRAKDLASRKAALVAMACVVPLVVIVGYSLEQRRLSDLGAACTKGTECRSGLCLELYDQGVSAELRGGKAFHGFPQRVGGVCTAECDGDHDCPSSMRCQPASRTQTYPNLELPMLGAPVPNAYACSPR